jgi:hypothetical protein
MQQEESIPKSVSVRSTRNTRYRVKNTRHRSLRDTFQNTQVEIEHWAKWICTKCFMKTRDNKILSIWVVLDNKYSVYGLRCRIDLKVIENCAECHLRQRKLGTIKHLMSDIDHTLKLIKRVLNKSE